MRLILYVLTLALLSVSANASTLSNMRMLMHRRALTSVPVECTLTAQDYTTYTKTVDNLSWITTLTSSTLGYRAPNNGVAKLYKDFGAGYFSGDVTAKWRGRVSSSTADWAEKIVFALTMSSVDIFNQTDDTILVEMRRTPTSGLYARIGIRESGTLYFSAPIGPGSLAYDTDYYFTFTRDASAGTNSTGLYTLTIYSDPSRTDQVATWSVNAGVGEQNAFRYAWALDNYSTGVGYIYSGNSYDLEIGTCLE